MTIRLFALLALSLSTLPAHADYALTAAASKWVSVAETDAYLQTAVCRASTQTSTSKEPVEFKMAYPTNGTTLPMVGLKTKLAPSLIAIKIDKNVFEYLFLLKAAATNEEPNLFWYAPVNFTRLETLVREKNVLDLVLDPKGATPTAIQVSLSGSANALDQVKKCLKTTAVPADFFKLLNAQKDALTPDLGDRSPLFLFTTVQQAFDAYKAGQKINLEIAALRKTVAPILAKEASALKAIQVASTNFTNATAKLNNANTLISTLTAKLADAKATLASLQAQKPIAEADLAKKKATYLPLKDKMVPFEKAIVDADKLVKGTQSDIASKVALINKNEKRIPELESERARLTRSLPGLRSEVTRTRSIYDDADSNYRRYDVRREAQNFLDRDSSYDWAKRDLQNAQRDKSDAQRKTWDAQRKMQDAKNALDNCQRQPTPNCGNEQSAYNSAESEYRSAWSNESQFDWKIRDAQSKIDRAEDDANRKAQSESDDLRRKRDYAESDYNSAANELSNAESRIADIRSLIPQLKKQIESAQAALPILRAKLAEQQATHAAKIADRDRFSLEIGFEVAKTEYLEADRVLKEIVAGIAAKTKEVPALTKQLADTQKTIPALTKSFEATKAALALAESKLPPIQEQLKTFRAEEGVKLAALEAESVKFKTGRAAYQDLIKILLGL